jgi:hypothetical protein
MSGQTLAAAVAAVVAAACTVVVVTRLTAATVALLDGAARGWSDVPYRIYYLTGGVLVVAYLAVGEMLLVLPGRTVTRLTAATMLFLTFAAAAAVLAARVDAGELHRAGATPPNGAIKGTWPAVLAIALNSAGTVVLLAGSILSARRRRDPRPLLVAAGVTLILLGLVTRRRSAG